MERRSSESFPLIRWITQLIVIIIASHLSLKLLKNEFGKMLFASFVQRFFFYLVGVGVSADSKVLPFQSLTT